AVSTARGPRMAIAVVGRVGDEVHGTAHEFLKLLPSGGPATITIDNPAQYERITGVVMNADTSATRDRFGDWIYRRDSQGFSTRATSCGSAVTCATSVATRCDLRRSPGRSPHTPDRRGGVAPGFRGTMATLAQGKIAMTTYISDQQAQRLAEIDLRTREAWADYTEELRELEGRDYEEAEDESWDRLQKRLRELDGERQLV